MRSLLLTGTAMRKVARALAAIDELSSLWLVTDRDASQAVREWLYDWNESLLRTIGANVVCGRYR